MTGDERLKGVLDRLSKELVEFFDAGFVVVTFKEGEDTKSAHIQFGNQYTVDGLLANIHSVLLQEEDEDTSSEIKNP